MTVDPLVLDKADGLLWSVCLVDEGGAELATIDAGQVLSTASVGKLLLLVEVAAQLADGRLDPQQRLTRTPADAVADSGLWQAMSSESLPLIDVAALIGATSDNLATNVLLRTVGLEAVAGAANRLGLRHTGLYDRVRDNRSSNDPPLLSSGTASELVVLMQAITSADSQKSPATQRVSTWIAGNADLSMVPAPWGLDPLAHRTVDRELTLVNKTGTDSGVRADVGVVGRGPRTVLYAAVANWSSDGPDRRDAALAGMAKIGRWIGRHLRGQELNSSNNPASV